MGLPNIKGFLRLLQKPLNSQIQGKPVFFCIKLCSLLGFNRPMWPWTADSKFPLSILLAGLAMVGGEVGRAGKRGRGREGKSTVVPIKMYYMQWKRFSCLGLSSLYQSSSSGEQYKTHNDKCDSGNWFSTHPLFPPLSTPLPLLWMEDAKGRWAVVASI